LLWYACTGIPYITLTPSFFVFVGFDVADLSEDAPDDVEGLDASAAHVANLLSTEPADSMVPELFSICSFIAA
jgi:hypothetical protein